MSIGLYGPAGNRRDVRNPVPSSSLRQMLYRPCSAKPTRSSPAERHRNARCTSLRRVIPEALSIRWLWGVRAGRHRVVPSRGSLSISGGDWRPAVVEIFLTSIPRAARSDPSLRERADGPERRPRRTVCHAQDVPTRQAHRMLPDEPCSIPGRADPGSLSRCPARRPSS